jgi:hypothetical protein
VLILADTTATANLTFIGGHAGQVVADGVVQAIDIKTWPSPDSVGRRRSGPVLGQPYPSALVAEHPVGLVPRSSTARDIFAWRHNPGPVAGKE